jgi:hypothetical protein
MDALENYGAIRGDSRQFRINDEIFTIRRIPARIQMDFLAWRVETTRPEKPKNTEQVDENIEYRNDTRNEFEFLLDCCVNTLNSARTQEQKSRFEVSVDWLLDNVSADMFEKLIYEVMAPFLNRLEEIKAEAQAKLVKMQKAALEPTMREMIQEEIQKHLKKPSNSSAKS